MKTSKKKTTYMIVGLIVSLALVILLLNMVDLGKVWDNLKKLSLQTIFIVLAIYIISMIVRAYRWKYLICQKHKINLRLTFKALVYGFMINQLLPAKVGELARAEYIARKKSLSRSFLIGTIAVERVFDLIVVAMFLGISFLFSETIKIHVKSNIVPIAAIVMGLVSIFIALYYLNEFRRITVHFPNKVQIIANRVIDNLLISSKLFHSVRQFTWLFVLSLSIWSMTCVVIYVILSNLSITIPFHAYFFIVSAGTFGMIIPSTSANVGVYHAVAMGSLMMFMVSREQALSFAIIAHAFDVFPSVILGGILFGYKGIQHLGLKKGTR